MSTKNMTVAVSAIPELRMAYSRIIRAANRRSPRLWALALVAGLALLFLAACTDAEVASFNALGKRHKITLYGNSGNPIESWTTTGAVTDVQGDGCYFEDEKTGLLVEIRGTMIIEVIK